MSDSYTADGYVLSSETKDKLLRLIDAQPGARANPALSRASQHVSIVQAGDEVTTDTDSFGRTVHIHSGTVQRLDASDLTWDQADSAVYLMAATGAPLNKYGLYLSIRSSEYDPDDDERPLYICDGSVGRTWVRIDTAGNPNSATIVTPDGSGGFDATDQTGVDVYEATGADLTVGSVYPADKGYGDEYLVWAPTFTGVCNSDGTITITMN